MTSERNVSLPLRKRNRVRFQRESDLALYRWGRLHVEELESRRLLTVVVNSGDADHQIWNLPATSDQVEIRSTAFDSFVIDSANGTFDDIFFTFSGSSIAINA